MLPLVALQELSRNITTAARASMFAQDALGILERVLGHPFGAVLLVNEADATLLPFALSEQGKGRAFVESDKAFVASHDVRVGKGITGWVAMHGKSARVGDVRKDPRYVGLRPDIRSELCVPITIDNKVIGVLNTESPKVDAYDECDELVLEIVASQIGFSIKMGQIARLDSLTGAANRRAFDEALQRELRRGARAAQPVSLLIFDIDFFKPYNDTYGHIAGDRCLCELAEIASGAFGRAGDLFARYGGEEFAVILPSTSYEEAFIAAERLRARVAAAGIPHAGSTVAPCVTVSVGVATASPGADTSESIIARADTALYRAKSSGRNRVA